MHATDLPHRCLWLFQIWLCPPTPNCPISGEAKNAGLDMGKFTALNGDRAKFWLVIGNCAAGEACAAGTGERVVFSRAAG